MNAVQRRQEILKRLHASDAPITASRLAAAFSVSRQIIVQDVALLREEGETIIATQRGYEVPKLVHFKRTFEVRHSDEDVARELELIVDLGGEVEDVSVYHRVYGIVRARLGIQTREDVDRFLQDVASGRSSLLKNVTSGYHTHLVSAASEETLNEIAKALADNGFLAPKGEQAH